MDCIFCKIAHQEMPTIFCFENDEIVAFDDLYPQAPHHVLIIPKTHIATLDDLSAADQSLAGNMMMAAQQIARERGIAESGYRILMNCRADGGQDIFHIHLHLLGGEPLGPIRSYSQTRLLQHGRVICKHGIHPTFQQVTCKRGLIDGIGQQQKASGFDGTNPCWSQALVI